MKYYKADLEHMLKIVEAIAEGKEVQYCEHGKENWATLNRKDPYILGDIKYRIKPETLKYRRYIMRYNDGLQVQCCMNTSIASSIYIESLEWFVRWIDTEWQEVEV